MIENIGNIEKYIKWYEEMSILNSKGLMYKAAKSRDSLNTENDLGIDFFYLPSLEDWQTLKVWRKHSLDIFIENFNNCANASCLPPVEFAKRAITERIQNFPIKHIECYKEPSPLPYKNRIMHEFIDDINTFDFLQYLHSYITDHESKPVEKNKLKWIGTNSELGFIIYELVDKGYIEAYRNPKTDYVNYNDLARQILESFNVDSTVRAMSQFLNPDCYKGERKGEKREEFTLPRSKNWKSPV